MKLSKFNLWVKDYPRQGESLLFNTRTQALIKVDQDLKQELNKCSAAGFKTQGARIKKYLNALKDNGIIVDDEKQEQDKLDDFFRQLKYESDKLTFEVTILTTYDCNFRCTYCFEESIKQNVFLNKNTSDLIIKWLIKKAEERGYKKIYLVYYGGEPLLNIKPIYDISWNLKVWTEKRGIDFGLGIITNGSLVSPELVDKLLPVGLQDIRVTVDGDKDAHNKKRPFCDGRPTFNLIMNNIKSVIDKVSIGIAGNFDRENFNSIFSFLDYLEDEGILHRLDSIDFTPLNPRLGPKDNPAAIELEGCFSFFSKDGLFKEVVAVKKELMKRGVSKVRTDLAVNACSLIMQDAGITIDPDGIIYKCNALVGYPEFSVGDVRCIQFNKKYHDFLNINAWNKCPKDCAYIPMCQGGCRFFSYMENKDFSKLSCKKEYLDYIVPDLIKLEYERLKIENKQKAEDVQPAVVTY